MILEKLRDAFDSEADVLKQALSIEREKTPAILQARGLRLKELTDRSDALLADLAALEEERHHLFQSFIAQHHTAFVDAHPGIESFVEALESFQMGSHRESDAPATQDWDGFLDDLIQSVSHFRETAVSLKREVYANQVLLGRTRRVIQGLMAELEPPAPTYSPEKKKSAASIRGPARVSLVLNTNA